MEQYKELTSEYLKVLFENEEQCLKFLSEVKWQDGFECRKCGHTNYCPGKSPFSRRCTRCKAEESATTGTIFHHCKFPINKAFYMAWHVCRGTEDLSTYEFARRLSLRQMTCWNFKKKIKDALDSISSLSENERSGLQKILTLKNETEA